MTRSEQLVSALGRLLPGATFRIADCRDWCSLTFTGQRVTIVGELAGVYRSAMAMSFVASLREQEFALPGTIVADIAVVDMRNTGKNVRLEIDALALDE